MLIHNVFMENGVAKILNYSYFKNYITYWYIEMRWYLK